METNISAAIPALSTKLAATDRPLSPWVEKYAWRFECYHPALAPVMPAVKRFCADVLDGSPARWLTLLGPSGIGKTLALKQAFRMLSRNEHLWEIPTDDAGSSRMPQCAHIIPGEDLTDWQAPRDYGGYDLLYIEDIGAGAYTGKGSGAVLSSRIAELLQYRTGRWTLICANLTRTDIANQLDPRIASRMKRDGSVMLELPDTIPDFNDR